MNQAPREQEPKGAASFRANPSFDYCTAACLDTCDRHHGFMAIQKCGTSEYRLDDLDDCEFILLFHSCIA